MNKLHHWWEFQEPMKLAGNQSFIIQSKSYEKREKNEIIQNDRYKTLKKSKQPKLFQEDYLRDTESSSDIKKVTQINMIFKHLYLNS